LIKYFKMTKNKTNNYLCLLAGIAGIILFISAMTYICPKLPGMAGEVYRNNLNNNIEATALIYTESGDVYDYLDTENGKYGFELDMHGHIK